MSAYPNGGHVRPFPSSEWPGDAIRNHGRGGDAYPDVNGPREGMASGRADWDSSTSQKFNPADSPNIAGTGVGTQSWGIATPLGAQFGRGD